MKQSQQFPSQKNEAKKPKHLVVGQIGEEIVVKHLVKQGFDILDRNYRKKYGEIDIVAKKDGILHFVEVKTVSCETMPDGYQPEENINFFKMKRLSNVIRAYLASGSVSCETEFQIDAMAVFLNQTTRKAKIRTTEGIIL
ncbi:MAG: YraN family protein [bacterium]|nr:YraN family protein [bacterium]